MEAVAVGCMRTPSSTSASVAVATNAVVNTGWSHLRRRRRIISSHPLTAKEKKTKTRHAVFFGARGTNSWVRCPCVRVPLEAGTPILSHGPACITVVGFVLSLSGRLRAPPPAIRRVLIAGAHWRRIPQPIIRSSPSLASAAPSSVLRHPPEDQYWSASKSQIYTHSF